MHICWDILQKITRICSVYMYEVNQCMRENWKVKTDRATTTQIVTGLQGGPVGSAQTREDREPEK